MDKLLIPGIIGIVVVAITLGGLVTVFKNRGKTP